MVEVVRMDAYLAQFAADVPFITIRINPVFMVNIEMGKVSLGESVLPKLRVSPN